MQTRDFQPSATLEEAEQRLHDYAHKKTQIEKKRKWDALPLRRQMAILESIRSGLTTF